jgi:predicted Rossmann fold nucleotide-binding protein DprA/Smf involved in DNA uptake
MLLATQTATGALHAVADITIVSGGQSGVDRGALEAAVMRSINM